MNGFLKYVAFELGLYTLLAGAVVAWFLFGGEPRPQQLPKLQGITSIEVTNKNGLARTITASDTVSKVVHFVNSKRNNWSLSNGHNTSRNPLRITFLRGDERVAVLEPDGYLWHFQRGDCEYSRLCTSGDLFALATSMGAKVPTSVAAAAGNEPVDKYIGILVRATDDTFPALP